MCSTEEGRKGETIFILKYHKMVFYEFSRYFSEFGACFFHFYLIDFRPQIFLYVSKNPKIIVVPFETSLLLHFDLHFLSQIILG